MCFHRFCVQNVLVVRTITTIFKKAMIRDSRKNMGMLERRQNAGFPASKMAGWLTPVSAVQAASL